MSESEIQEQVRAIAAREGWTERKTEKFLEQQDLLGTLRSEMREMKTRAFLRENVLVEEIDSTVFEERYADKLPGDQKSGRIEVVG